ncbi:hypothetical protein E2C01_081017 [Portunus trituberculatus]|uniref:Uncharacterized protein n=1 Tax=Portunus trituberculatus TaxID=210409 RepID=A0A5B7IZX5_PORTR|nr:hypothetical protein [Portunus trituberculatus]
MVAATPTPPGGSLGSCFPRSALVPRAGGDARRYQPFPAASAIPLPSLAVVGCLPKPTAAAAAAAATVTPSKQCCISPPPPSRTNLS